MVVANRFQASPSGDITEVMEWSGRCWTVFEHREVGQNGWCQIRTKIFRLFYRIVKPEPFVVDDLRLMVNLSMVTLQLEGLRSCSVFIFVYN